MAVNTEEAWLIEDRDGDVLRVEWESAVPAQVGIKINPDDGTPYLVFEEDGLAELIDTLSEILDAKVRAQK